MPNLRIFKPNKADAKWFAQAMEHFIFTKMSDVWDTFHTRFIKKTGAQNNPTLAYSNIENFANNASILTYEDILEIGDAGLSNEISFRTQFPF